MPPQSLPQSSSSVFHLPGRCISPRRLLGCSFFPCLFFLLPSLLLTSLSTHLLSLSLFPSSFLMSHERLSSLVPLSHHPSLLSLSPRHLPACHVFCCSFSICFLCTRLPSSQSPFLIFLVTALLLPTSLPVVALCSICLFDHSHLHPLHNTGEPI